MNDDAINYATLQARIQMKAAEARKAEEWFDIFQDVVFSGVRQTITQSQSVEALNKVEDVLKDHATYFRAVRDKIRVHGMDISEGVEWEGPEIDHDHFGIARIMGWPHGMWAKATWGDGSSIKFLGKHAEIAVSFVIWWTSFHQVYVEQTQQGVIIPEATKKRLLSPGTPDWINYYKNKEAELKGNKPT